MKKLKNINGRRIILALILVGAAMLLVRHNVGTCFVIEGNSMAPTFSPNDVVLAKTFQGESKRGDLLIITDDCGERVLKRIIGLPGETVTIHKGFVYINGQRLSEPYLPKFTYTFESNSAYIRRMDWRLGGSQFFVMGDNRIASRDSRDFGLVAREDIRSIVALSEEAARPAFCEILLSQSGKPFRGKLSPGKNQTRSSLQSSHPKI
jgi:signal peptidase I